MSDQATAASLTSIEAIVRGLEEVGYIASRRIATALYMAAHLQKPVLVEGVAGVGKTELALSTAAMLGLPLIRLQCYEGLDEGKALYEWDYAKQMLFTQLLRASAETVTAGAADLAEAVERVAGAGEAFFSPRFLVERPILRALRSPVPAVLLIDEVDRADPEFEAFLLEVLAENQVTLPEIDPSADVTVRPIAVSACCNALVVSIVSSFWFVCTVWPTAENEAIWLRYCVGSVGFVGSWFCSSATSSLRKLL